jgi:hypothetical protein
MRTGVTILPGIRVTHPTLRSRVRLVPATLLHGRRLRRILSAWLHLPRWNLAQDIPEGSGTQDWRFVTEQLRAVRARPVALFKGMR